MFVLKITCGISLHLWDTNLINYLVPEHTSDNTYNFPILEIIKLSKTLKNFMRTAFYIVYSWISRTCDLKSWSLQFFKINVKVLSKECDKYFIYLKIRKLKD